jgi:hypothetical protein
MEAPEKEENPNIAPDPSPSEVTLLSHEVIREE